MILSLMPANLRALHSKNFDVTLEHATTTFIINQYLGTHRLSVIFSEHQYQCLP